jgi:hypothetical protein
MGERGGAMTVISLQKQPGTVERDGSRRASPPILAAASLPTGHSVAEPLLAIGTSDFDQCLQLAGASHARAAAGVYGAGPSGYLNSEARFCCRFAADAARRDHRCNSRLLNRTAAGQAARLSGSPAPAGRRSDQVGRESLIGWIGAMRPSRRPHARPPQDEELSSCHQRHTLILRSAERRVSKDARR